MAEHTQVVNGGPKGRPAGTAAKRRPLTTRNATATTIDNAPPTGRGLQANGAARSAAHTQLFGVDVMARGERPSTTPSRYADVMSAVRFSRCSMMVASSGGGGAASAVFGPDEVLCRWRCPRRDDRRWSSRQWPTTSGSSDPVRKVVDARAVGEWLTAGRVASDDAQLSVPREDDPRAVGRPCRERVVFERIRCQVALL
jgi:hypothetical protein